jgi:hypothetical protein
MPIFQTQPQLASAHDRGMALGGGTIDGLQETARVYA